MILILLLSILTFLNANLCDSKCVSNPCGCSLFPCANIMTTQSVDLKEGFSGCQDSGDPIFDVQTYQSILGSCNCPYMSINDLCEATANSGVKIGSGIDLRYQTVEGLLGLNVSMSIVDKLRPYIGVENFPALSIQFETLNLSDQEVQELNNQVLSKNAANLGNQYDVNLGYDEKYGPIPDDKPNWMSLSKGIRTAIFTYVAQYGSYASVPDFWNYALTLQYNKITQMFSNKTDPNYTTRQEQNTLIVGCGNKCSGSSKVDVLFVMDASGSIGPTNYQKEVDFVYNVTSNLTMGALQQQVAVLIFATNNDLRQNFTGNQSQALAAIRNVPYPGQTTATNNAYILAKQLFETQKQTRDGATQIMFLITDGVPNNPMNQTLISQMIQEDGINIVTVGVGAGINQDNLIELAGGSNYTDNVYSINNWNLIVQMLNNFQTRVCQTPSKVESTVASNGTMPAVKAVLTKGYTYFQVSQTHLNLQLNLDDSLLPPALSPLEKINYVQSSDTLQKLKIYYSFTIQSPGQLNNDGISFLVDGKILANINNNQSQNTYFSLFSNSSSQVGVSLQPSKLYTSCGEGCQLCFKNKTCAIKEPPVQEGDQSSQQTLEQKIQIPQQVMGALIIILLILGGLFVVGTLLGLYYKLVYSKKSKVIAIEKQGEIEEADDLQISKKQYTSIQLNNDQ